MHFPLQRARIPPNDHAALARFIQQLPSGAVFVVRPTLEGGWRVAAWRTLRDAPPIPR